MFLPQIKLKHMDLADLLSSLCHFISLYLSVPAISGYLELQRVGHD